ncbi:DUF3618 domain-containing protein [Corynebacterium caspium]|uniref:DUF3618 domain-containing protein n=1 Tax=Corynebacterium caspium TaxID=234828 RepID=UPI00036B6D1E|nr:DUF3618 domain-containing protein [Corynebacterium caspium]WKD58808.1 hypothetical protein CCASP_01965 [Corynebacterium caspium DSM 44850]
MARDINDIERDIERTRRQLAGTLDEIAERTKPARLANEAKRQITATLKDPKVQAVLAGVGVAVATVVVFGIKRGRRNKQDLKDLQRLLAAK